MSRNVEKKTARKCFPTSFAAALSLADNALKAVPRGAKAWRGKSRSLTQRWLWVGSLVSIWEGNFSRGQLLNFGSLQFHINFRVTRKTQPAKKVNFYLTGGIAQSQQPQLWKPEVSFHTGFFWWKQTCQLGSFRPAMGSWHCTNFTGFFQKQKINSSANKKLAKNNIQKILLLNYISRPPPKKKIYIYNVYIYGVSP